jgi:hypothetical protein
VDDEELDDFIYGDVDMAPWKQWHKIYADKDTVTKTKKRVGKKEGVILLAVRQLRGNSKKFWAAVNDGREVGPVDLSNKKAYRPRGRTGWTYGKFRPLSRAEQASAEALAATLRSNWMLKPLVLPPSLRRVRDSPEPVPLPGSARTARRSRSLQRRRRRRRLRSEVISRTSPGPRNTWSR